MKVYKLIILLLFFSSCKTKEQNKKEQNQVLFCKTNEFEKFISKANIKPEEARNIVYDFAKNHGYNIVPKLFYFIIQEHYVFTSYIQPKVPEVGVIGIWVNANTGEAIEVDKGLPLMAYDEYEWKQ